MNERKKRFRFRNRCDDLRYILETPVKSKEHLVFQLLENYIPQVILKFKERGMECSFKYFNHLVFFC